MPDEVSNDSLIINAARSLGTAAAKIASLAGVTSGSDAIALLKKDHETVKDIFERFGKAEDPAAKRALVEQALTELKIHAALEEELFYPTVRKAAGEDLINEADEEHHVVKVLIAELEGMDGSEDHYAAKFKVLAENVRHHIREEENEIFPKAKSMEMDWEGLGRTLLQRKQELLASGIPAGIEKPKNGRRKSARRARRNKSTA